MARLWLQFKIFDVMGILKNLNGSTENQQKRKKIAETIAAYKFPGSNLEDLLRQCFSAISQKEEDIEDLISMIKEKKGESIVSLAFKEAEPEPEPIIVVPGNDPSSEEQLRNMIEDYKHLP